MIQPAYLDTNLSIAERVQDLLSRLILDEKVGMMNHPAQGVPCLDIPDYNFWSEAPHGVAVNGRATVFPQAIGMAACAGYLTHPSVLWNFKHEFRQSTPIFPSTKMPLKDHFQ